MKNNLLLFFIGLTLNCGAWASPQSYETLKAAYIDAPVPAATSDLENYNYTTWGKRGHSKCVVEFTQFTRAMDVVLARINYTDVVTPAAGPLLPTQLGKGHNTVGFIWPQWNMDIMFDGLDEATTISNDSSDLIIDYSGSNLVPNIDHSVTKVRKNGELLLFSQVYFQKNESMPVQVYGYCYKN
jgi:hypothetical protein